MNDWLNQPLETMEYVGFGFVGTVLFVIAVFFITYKPRGY